MSMSVVVPISTPASASYHLRMTLILNERIERIRRGCVLVQDPSTRGNLTMGKETAEKTNAIENPSVSPPIGGDGGIDGAEVDRIINHARVFGKMSETSHVVDDGLGGHADPMTAGTDIVDPSEHGDLLPLEITDTARSLEKVGRRLMILAAEIKLTHQGIRQTHAWQEHINQRLVAHLEDVQRIIDLARAGGLTR